MTRNHYQNAHAVLIVYGLDSIESYKSVENHVHDVGNYCNNPDIKIFIVGNKCDLESERKVTYDDG